MTLEAQDRAQREEAELPAVRKLALHEAVPTATQHGHQQAHQPRQQHTQPPAPPILPMHQPIARRAQSGVIDHLNTLSTGQAPAEREAEAGSLRVQIPSM